MMLPRLYWWLIVLVTASALSIATALAVGYRPVAADFADPLGRPAELARSITRSTAIIDVLASDIHDKHRRVADTSMMVVTIAGHLDRVVGRADDLGPLSATVSGDTDALTTDALPLPPLIADLTRQARQATGIAEHLSAGVETVTGRLQDIGRGLREVDSDLTALGTRARAISTTLRELQRDTAPVRPLGPVLGHLTPVLGRIGR